MAQSSIERQSSLDALRGFALLGILVVNIIAFATPYYGTGVPDPMAQSRVSHAVMAGIALLFEWKFYLLFSFLFGYSFTLQMQSAERDGKAFVPRMLRRLVGLWVLGLLHGVLLFHGDILTTYAVMGAVLLALRSRADKTLTKLAVGLIVGTATVWAIIGVLSVLDVDATRDSKALAEVTAALTAFRSTPSGVIAQHVEALKGMWVVTALMQAPTALAMFLMGCLAGRRGLLAARDLGTEYFRYDEAGQRLVGDESGEEFTLGQRLRLRLVEANPVSGALRFELPDGKGSAGPSAFARDRGKGRPRPIKRRGRPPNIRHKSR